MIFEKVVRWVINTYLSQFIENVNYSDINVGLLNGKISLTNVKVKNDAIEKFVSGLKVSRAIVNKIDISIPWTSGLFIPPTTILVDGLYIVVAPPNETTISNDEEMAWQQKLKKIDFLEAARKLRETSVENEESKKTKSITEKLGVTIIKNLQFTITNIHIRYENMPNSMGVFIQSLQFQTTNKYWNVDDEENENSSNTESAEEDVDYKLIILKDFGIYSCKNKINLTEKTLTEFKDYLSVEGFIKRCHDRQNCILKPVTLVLRSKINMNPENHNFSMSKFVFDLVFGEISIRISKYNAKFVLNELKAISMRKRYNKYNHLRPKIQISKAPKEWFKFAVNCYLENIRKHNNQWDMTNIFNYRKYFKLYIQVYKDKLCNINKDDKSTTEQNEILMDCEKLLSVFSIMLGRKLAEIEAKKTGLYPPKESSGWIPSWMKWGTGKSTEETNLSKEIEGGFTEEEKNKMYSAIGYVDSTLDDSIYPENYSIIVFKCVLSRFQLKLEDNLRNQVLEGIVDKFSFLISMRDKGFTFTVNTDYFAVFGAYPVPHKYKTTSDASTISSLSQKESVVAPKIIFLRKRENILNLKISKNPVDVSADYAIEMISEGMDVIYDSHTANRMVEWFSELNVDDVSNKVALAASTTLNIYRDRFNLHQILDNSIYVDLKFLVKSSRFIIPENGVYLNENSFFSLNFGDFNVVSHKTQRDDFNFNNVPISEMMDRVYDKFDIHLIDFGLGLNMPDGEIINLVEPIKLDLNLSKSIIPALFELPAMKMEAFLSKLDFKVKVDELQRIVKIILSIPAISFPTKDEKPLVSIVEQVKLVKDVDSRTEAINEISEMDDFISAKMSFDESDGGSIEENMDNVTQFKIAFTVDAINLTVIDTTASKSTMVAINLKKIGISVNINKYSKKMHLFVESVNASYENDNLGKVQNLIDTKETEKLISISVSQFDKNYISRRDEFAIKAKIDCDYLKICIYQPAVIFLKETCLNMYETILTNNNSNAFTTQYHEYRQSVNMYAISRSESGFTNYLKTFSQMPEFDQDSTMENTKNVDLDINVSQICIEFMDIVCLNLTGFSMDVKLLRNDSEIGVTLENLEILNIEQDAVYKNIFIVNKKLEKTENLLNLHVKSFTVRPIEEKFDVIIDLKCLQVEFVFISVFLKKIANKCEIFAIKKESIDTLTQSISKSAKFAVDTASNLLIGFNIQVISPKLILPTNSESIQVLYANLGSLKISNEYSIGIPLIDDILISMDNISLYSLKYTDRINNNFNKHVIIEPIHVDLNLQRNVQFNMDKSQPMINAFMDVNECNFKISYLDLKYILAIWYENINEVYENVSTKTEKVEKVKKVSFKDQENIETNNVQVKYKGKKVKKKSNDKPKIVEISFKFHLKTLQLILLDDTIIVKNEVSDENLRNNFRNIALVEIENLSLDLKILTNEDLSVEISLKNITLQDLRPERSVIHQIFERSNCYDCDKIIKATYTKEEGSQTPLLFVSIEKIVVCIWLEYLMELKDFFLKAFKREKPKKKHSKKQLQVEQVPETLSLNSDSSFEYVEETMEVVIVFSDPEFIMVDDRSNLNSRCFIAKSNLMVKCQLSDDVTLAFVELNNLEIFCSTFHLESRDKFKVKILNKTNMTVRYDINNLNSDVDASINAELFQFYMCPSTINLFFSILKNLSIKEDDSKHEEAFDFNKFWEIDKIVNQNFEFMKYALPVDVGSEGTSLSDVTEFFNNEKMNVVIENFIIHISDTQNSENNFIIEGGVSGIVESWSHNLVANLNTTIEVGYYNDRLAVWEPLLEPINQKSGVNKDAYRSFNLSIFYETNDLVEELDEDFRIPPPFNHVKVTSIDQLNLTLTKRAMHMLHRVATLFNDAYQLKENDCTHNKTDNNKMPFFIENISGLNITVKLDKNLEFSENSKCTSKLINTGNCAYFSYKEKSKIINNKFLDHGYLESTAQMEIGFSTNKIKINAIKYDLYPVAVNSNTMVVIDVNCCNDRQNIIIRSMYQVRNLLPYALAIKCFSKSVNNGKLIDIGSCQKNETLCIPVQHTLADTKMIISIENYVSEEIGNVFETNFKSTIKFTNSDGECRYIDSYLKKKIISLNDKSKDKTMYYLMFTPIMTFTNLLPFSIVFKNKEIVDEFMIKSGNCEIFDTLKNNSGSITVQFSYSNNDWSCVFNLVENEKFKKLTFTSSDQMEKLNLNLEIANEDGYYCVKIYSYYWLINKTSRNLVYKNNENLIISHPTGNESIVLMNRTNRVSLSIENSSWSKHFSLDAVGTLGLINCKKNNEEEEVSVSITLANFGLTRIITFSPFCFVSNLTWFKLKILQCKNIENSDPLILDPGKSKPLIIDSSGEELSFIVVALGENNTKKSMSVPFFPSKSSITTLFLQDPFVGVSVETNITESKLIMKFHNLDKHSAQWIILNDYKMETVKFYQKNSIEKIYLLKPNTYQRYTWQNHKEQYELICSIESQKDITIIGMGKRGTSKIEKLFYFFFFCELFY
ncbi:hypothetical protein A3Q56_03206 [Intoshia linei]|uniref:Vacuolar protein sorting-associated protein 13A n=1 Tax=Intoshia linei TaxID=1819745 RepID=A0A177B426_9BILA|nr:hypothetical protein A3Q56_03206 [Intoshia linei]